MPKVHYLEPMPWADNALPDTRPLTDAEWDAMKVQSGIRARQDRMATAFIPEDTPPAMTDRYEADKALAEMDAAYIRPVFFTVVLLALVVLVLAIVTGTECAGCGL